MLPRRDEPRGFKTHRACAIRCIAGGIPPLFVVRAPDGTRTHYLLVDEGGRSVNDRVLGMVADPLEIRGRVTRDGGSLVLRADPATYLRLP